MIRLEKPKFKVVDILTTHKTRSSSFLSNKIDKLIIELPTFERKYNIYGLANKLEKYIPAEQAAYSDLGTFYKMHLVKATKLRPFYDKIILNSPNKTCVYCLREFSALEVDHFLPKQKYKEFAVTPLNLLPSCPDCNKSKLNKVDGDILNSYFIKEEWGEWLKATIVNYTYLTLDYKCVPSESLSPELSEKMKKHFDKFGISKRLNEYAANEISMSISAWHTVYKRGKDDLLQRLTDDYESSLKASYLNHWRPILYKTLLDAQDEFEQIFSAYEKA